MFADVSNGSDFFDAQGALDSKAILLIEPEEFRPNVPSAKYGAKDAVVATVTSFAEGSSDPKVEHSVMMQQTLLVRALRPLCEGRQATVVTLRQLPPNNGNKPAYVFDPGTPEQKATVSAYITARDEQVAKDKDSAPDF